MRLPERHGPQNRKKHEISKTKLSLSVFVVKVQVIARVDGRGPDFVFGIQAERIDEHDVFLGFDDSRHKLPGLQWFF
jgi:hypothetical protein